LSCFVLQEIYFLLSISHLIIIGRVLLFSAVHYGTNSGISQKLVFFILYTATMSYFVLQTHLLKKRRGNNLLISFNTEHKNILCRRLTETKWFTLFATIFHRKSCARLKILTVRFWILLSFSWRDEKYKWPSHSVDLLK
jgi:hypothetical protein